MVHMNEYSYKTRKGAGQKDLWLFAAWIDVAAATASQVRISAKTTPSGIFWAGDDNAVLGLFGEGSPIQDRWCRRREALLN